LLLPAAGPGLCADKGSGGPWCGAAARLGFIRPGPGHGRRVDQAGIQVLENLVIFGKDSMDVEPNWPSPGRFPTRAHLDLQAAQGRQVPRRLSLQRPRVYDFFARVISRSTLLRYGQWKYVNTVFGAGEGHPGHRRLYHRLGHREAFAPLLNNLALWLCPIVSPKAMADFKDKIGMNPVGTGPFKFKSWTKDDQIVLERNNDYWARRPRWSASC